MFKRTHSNEKKSLPNKTRRTFSVQRTKKGRDGRKLLLKDKTYLYKYINFAWFRLRFDAHYCYRAIRTAQRQTQNIFLHWIIHRKPYAGREKKITRTIIEISVWREAKKDIWKKKKNIGIKYTNNKNHKSFEMHHCCCFQQKKENVLRKRDKKKKKRNIQQQCT